MKYIMEVTAGWHLGLRRHHQCYKLQMSFKLTISIVISGITIEDSKFLHKT